MRTRNRISEKDTLKIRVYDKRGKIVKVVYDSGFKNIPNAIAFPVNGLQCTVKEITVYNERNEKYEYYNVNGKKL